MGVESRRDIGRLLESIERKIYAAWRSYAALAFAYWIPILNCYMAITSTAWFQGLDSRSRGLVTAAYWFLIGVAGAGLSLRYLARYLSRLEAAGYRKGKACGKIELAGWIAGMLASLLLYDSMVAVYGKQRANAAWLLLFIAVGTGSVALREYCTVREYPTRPYTVPRSLVASLLSALGLGLLPLTPPSAYASMVFAASLVTLGYSIVVILYVLDSFRLVVGQGEEMVERDMHER